MQSRFAYYALITLIVIVQLVIAFLSPRFVLVLGIVVSSLAIFYLHRRRQRWLRLYIKMYMNGLIMRDVQ